ncbi:hypothetical protein ABIC83_002583 [Roseateles asaccharophilus]|uniref:hypothetical protein n=1 Tax=Roseateles asaccharophilus TaxID=582607 RepID=UPI003834D7B7
MDSMLRLWHGSHGWEPPPTIRPPKNGNAEHGAGLYLTSHYLTAHKYAKGGGATMDVFVDPSLKLIEGMKISADTMIAAARAIPRLRKREEIIDDIKRCSERSKEPGIVGLDVLINLAVNHDAMIGNPAVEITKFVVSQGADGSLYERIGGEDWLVIFNPAVIHTARRRPAATVELHEYDRLRVRAQLELLRSQAPALQTAVAPRKPSFHP